MTYLDNRAVAATLSSAITPASTSASTTSMTSALIFAQETFLNPSSTFSNASLNPGPIAGIIAGCIVLILLGIAGYMVHRRRRRPRYVSSTNFTKGKQVDPNERSTLPTTPVPTLTVQAPLKLYVRFFPRVLLMLHFMPPQHPIHSHPMPLLYTEP